MSSGALQIQGGTYTATGLTTVSGTGTLQVDSGLYAAVSVLVSGGLFDVNGGNVTASGPTPDVAPEYTDFHRVTMRLRELQLSGDLSLGYIQDEQTVPVMKFSESAQTGSAYAERRTGSGRIGTDRNPSGRRAASRGFPPRR